MYLHEGADYKVFRWGGAGAQAHPYLLNAKGGK